MDTLVSMRVFRQVVESGGFTAAAAVLEMSVAMVSKHVFHLENHLGTRLLNRTSRKVALNDPGARYYERCCEILDQLEEAENGLGKVMEKPSGTLRVTAPTWFSNRFFARALCEYRRRFPEVHLDISLSDAFVDLVDEGLDVALRVMQKAETSQTTRYIITMDFAVVASHEYLQRKGRPSKAQDLEGHDLLVYSYLPKGLFWEKPGWRMNNTTLIAQLAAEGAGLAILPRLLFDEESFRDQLEVVEINFSLPSPSLYVVTHGRRHYSPRVRSFMDFFATLAAPICRRQAGEPG
ncbi:MAG: LysR family transcriptional regulator [Candidatus Eremiobacteraeota bacterium]|nr:LysR family transcriptional regulator [Candidatus Eremiobacteraeota bacterium]MCW5867545.1 LysR family transcriptional regulator [Candidatus Eremiobacteraeota bacterium]